MTVQTKPYKLTYQNAVAVIDDPNAPDTLCPDFWRVGVAQQIAIDLLDNPSEILLAAEHHGSAEAQSMIKMAIASGKLIRDDKGYLDFPRQDSHEDAEDHPHLARSHIAMQLAYPQLYLQIFNEFVFDIYDRRLQSLCALINNLGDNHSSDYLDDVVKANDDEPSTTSPDESVVKPQTQTQTHDEYDAEFANTDFDDPDDMDFTNAEDERFDQSQQNYASYQPTAESEPQANTETGFNHTFFDPTPETIDATTQNPSETGLKSPVSDDPGVGHGVIAGSAPKWAMEPSGSASEIRRESLSDGYFIIESDQPEQAETTPAFVPPFPYAPQPGQNRQDAIFLQQPPADRRYPVTRPRKTAQIDAKISDENQKRITELKKQLIDAKAERAENLRQAKAWRDAELDKCRARMREVSKIFKSGMEKYDTQIEELNTEIKKLKD